MAKPDHPDNLAWGTLEELLLACAVHRHGTNCWDSVAKEIQKRSSGTAFHLFTSLNCKQKYFDLKRRFAAPGDGDAFPCLDELRRRRIAELKRELERNDLSIVSLQSKVKRLSEEREKSLTENEREVSDLQKSVEGGKAETQSAPLPESGADAEPPAEESDREKHSVNSSNESDRKDEKSEEDGDEVAGEEKPVEPAADPAADLTAKPAAEGSYNGSTETIAAAKGTAGSQDLGSAKSERVCDSPELVESVAESKREEEGMEKETSEVQSKGRGNSGEENQIAAGKPGSVMSQPLADFLDVIRRHKFGSVFERRLDSQESSNYKTMIRQHVDLATVSRRLGEGQYAEHHSKFYRDLLLLVTNATLFFPNRSPEHIAAIELRQLVSTKIPRHPSKPAHLPTPPPAPTAHPKPEPEMSSQPPADSPPPPKPKLMNPVIVCRKRSSVVLKPLSGEKKRADSSSNTNDEKPSWFSAVTKKRTRDQSSVSRSSGAKMSGSKSSSEGPSSKEASREKKKNEKDNNNNATSSGGVNKKIVAKFLNRIRRGSTDPSESVKRGSNANSRSNNKGGGGGEVRKNGGVSHGKSSKSEAPASTKEKGKQKEGGNDESSNRNVGRPPKRAAAMAGVGKRRREGGDKAEGAEALKKRSRK